MGVTKRTTGRGGGKVGRKLGGVGPGAPVVGGALRSSEQQGPAARVRLRVQDLEVGVRLHERVDDVLGPVVTVYGGTVASLSGTEFKSVTAFRAGRMSRAGHPPGREERELLQWRIRTKL